MSYNIFSIFHCEIAHTIIEVRAFIHDYSFRYLGQGIFTGHCWNQVPPCLPLKLTIKERCLWRNAALLLIPISPLSTGVSTGIWAVLRNSFILEMRGLTQ